MTRRLDGASDVAPPSGGRARDDALELLERERTLLRRAVAAEHASDAILALLAQELRAPLNAASAWSRMVRQELLSKDGRDRALVDVERNVELALQLVDELLDIARLGRGARQVVLAPISLGDAVAAAVASAASAADERHLAVELHDDAGGTTLEADRTRFVRLLSRLFATAAGLAVPSTPLRLSTSHEDDDRVLVEASFEPVPACPARYPRGWDDVLGNAPAPDPSKVSLFIVRNLAEAHGGSADLLFPGGGRATLRIELPAPGAPSTRTVTRSARHEERDRIREALSVLVPLAADACAFDLVSPDGERTFAAGVHLDRARERALSDWSLRPESSTRVAVEAMGTRAGELVIWSTRAPNALEEALICVTAERLGDLLEKRLLSAAVADAGAGVPIGPPTGEEPREARLDLLGHELRGPLQVLTMGFELIRTRIRDSADEVPHAWLLERIDSLERATARLGDLAEQVGEAARFEPGSGGDAQRELVDLGAVIEKVLARMEDELAWSACSVALDIDPTVPLEGRWDPVHLETIVGNLLSNAMKYGAGQPVDVRITADDTRVTLVVRDRGLGIAPEERTKIFERFYRGSSAKQLPGLGLGLAVVRQLVNANGGDILVESYPGEGATFRIRLPRALTPSAWQALPRSTPGARSP